MTSSTSTGANHIALLDGMRGVAAIVVVAGHSGVVSLNNSLPVDFFFLLSGYVVALAYEQKFRRGLSFTEFAKIRMVRLYPTIFLGSLLMFGNSLAGFNPVQGDFAFVTVMQFALLPVFAPKLEVFRLNGVQWSLFFELVANALHRLAFPILNTAVLAIICLLSFVGLLAACVHYTTFTLGWWGENFIVGFPRVCFSYFAGVLVFRLAHGRPLPRLPGWLVISIFIAVSFTPNIPGVPVNGLRLTILAIAFPTLLVAAINAKMSAALTSVCVLLGEISYPLYATHQAILFPVDHLTSGATGTARAAIDLAAIFGTLVLGLVVSRLWDRPIRSWLRRRTSSHAP